MKKLVLIGIALLAIIATPVLLASTKSNKDVIVLSSDNTIVLNGEVNGENASNIIQQAKRLGGDENRFRVPLGSLVKPKPIYLFLFTPGGNVEVGREIIEALRGNPRPINTVVLFAASMGFQITQQLGTRFVMANSTLMSHHASGGAQGQLGGRGVSQIMSRIGFWERVIRQMDERTVERTDGRQTLKSYQEAYDHELWVNGTEAVEQGYADKIVTVRCDDTLSGYAKHRQLVDTPFGPMEIEYEADECPLNTNPVNVKALVNTNRGSYDIGTFLAQGGGFGPQCLQMAGLNPKQLCVIDTRVTLDKINDVVNIFKDKYENIQNHVIPLTY